MTISSTRRAVLRGIGAGAISITAVGRVAAGDDTRYITLVTGPEVEDRIERAGFSVQHVLANGGVMLVVGSSDDREDLEDVRGVQEVARDIELQVDEPEFTESTSESTDEDLFPQQWDKQDLTTDAAIAHDTATGDGTRLAIIDSGVESGHADLMANTNEAAGRLFRFGAVKQGSGDVELPVDWFDLSKGTETVTRHVANDVLGHGTHVAGIAAASNDGTTGVIGTAPDAEIVSLRVFFWREIDGDAVLWASFGDLITAIDHAAGIGSDALNMSLGTPPLPPQVNATGIRGALERVIDTATAQGTVVVNAAGNDATDLDGGEMMFPASIAGAMAISATGPNDKLVFYSNYGHSVIDVGAPGGGYETLQKTLETDPTKVDWPFPTNLVLNAMDPDTLFGQLLGDIDDDENVEEVITYAYLAGTSMATPQVTGTVGLVREIAPNSDAETVEKAIEQGAELVNGRNDELGAGRLNCDKTLEAPALRR